MPESYYEAFDKWREHDPEGICVCDFNGFGNKQKVGDCIEKLPSKGEKSDEDSDDNSITPPLVHWYRRKRKQRNRKAKHHREAYLNEGPSTKSIKRNSNRDTSDSSSDESEGSAQIQNKFKFEKGRKTKSAEIVITIPVPGKKGISKRLLTLVNSGTKDTLIRQSTIKGYDLKRGGTERCQNLVGSFTSEYRVDLRNCKVPI